MERKGGDRDLPFDSYDYFLHRRVAAMASASASAVLLPLRTYYSHSHIPSIESINPGCNSSAAVVAVAVAADKTAEPDHSTVAVVAVVAAVVPWNKMDSNRGQDIFVL